MSVFSFRACAPCPETHVEQDNSRMICQMNFSGHHHWPPLETFHNRKHLDDGRLLSSGGKKIIKLFSLNFQNP
uniref:Uncharacterized protein n=1 Tax=Anguilla anguilla TaxID=7936 RepID=A0A0E9X2B0_ANGAN